MLIAWMQIQYDTMQDNLESYLEILISNVLFILWEISLYV